MKIGIVGFQGDVEEHAQMLDIISEKRGEKIEVVRIRKMDDIKDLSGIIMPGGESTTIYKLIQEYGIYDEIIKAVKERGIPLMGTCAGIIIASGNTNDERVRGMGLLDIEIERNAYGRQHESFIEEVNIRGIGNFPAVFIRAPAIKSTGDVEILASLKDKAIMVRKDNVIGLTFHPELTDDTRVHEYFIGMIGGGGTISSGEHEMKVRS